MKTTLTIQESAELIKRGVSADKASMCRLYYDYDGEIIGDWETWEDCGKILANVDDEIIEVESKIVPKDGDFDHSFAEDTPIFTLADLLSLLPKEVIADTRFCKNETCPINIRWDYTMGIWFVAYELVSLPDGIGEDSELINALFSTLLWAIDHNHVKLD